MSSALRGLLVSNVQRVRRSLHRLQGRQFLHLLHIGKTGGTAIKHALRPYSMHSLRPLPRTQRYAIYLHNHSCKMRDVPEGEKVAFVLRDPISRFVSSFYSRQRRGQPRIHSAWSPDEEMAFKTFQTPDSLGSALSSNDELTRVAAVHAMRAIEHVRNSFMEWFDNEAYFMSRRGDILFIGYQESLAADFERFKSLIGLPDHARLPTDEIHSHRNPSNLDRSLSEEALSNLRTWYRADYDFISLCQADLAATGGRTQGGLDRRHGSAA